MKILKYVISIGVFFGSVRAFIEGNILMGLFFLIFALLVFPTISEMLKNKFPQWQNKYIRYGVLIGLIILGGAMKSKVEKETLEASPEFIAEKFFKENPNNQLIKVADTLLKLDDYFDSEDSKKYFYDKSYKGTSDGDILYNFLDITKDSLFNEYQNLQNGKYLIDYNLKFSVKDKKVNSVKAIATYNDGSKREFTESDIFTIPSLLNTSEIGKMREAVAKLEKAQKLYKNIEERKANFEKECFTGLDGYNLSLVNLVKENMNDDDSFEHVETKYKMMNEYAIVTMKFRGNNKFGAKVLNTITAKINYDCQVIKIIE